MNNKVNDNQPVPPDDYKPVPPEQLASIRDALETVLNLASCNVLSASQAQGCDILMALRNKQTVAVQMVTILVEGLNQSTHSSL